MSALAISFQESGCAFICENPCESVAKRLYSYRQLRINNRDRSIVYVDWSLATNLQARRSNTSATDARRLAEITTAEIPSITADLGGTLEPENSISRFTFLGLRNLELGDAVGVLFLLQGELHHLAGRCPFKLPAVRLVVAACRDRL